MMGCTLGRITGLESPNRIRQEGDRLRIGGDFAPTSVEEGVALAQQVVGYPSPDEEVVPFTYDATAAGGVLDGFYFVVSTQVDWAKLAAGLFSWEAELVAVPAKQTPIFEVNALGAVRTNSHSVVAAGVSSWAALPGSAVGSSWPSPTSVETATGDALVVVDSADSLFNGNVTYYAAPGGFYDAACLIERSDDNGATWQTVVGRPSTPSPRWLRISNGLSRVTWQVNGVTGYWDLRVEAYDTASNAYEATDFMLAHDSSGGAPPETLYAATVLRNSPECVTVRYSYVTTLGVDCSVDLTVRRGVYTVEGVITRPENGTLGAWRTASENATSITGGIEATSANPSGNKYTLLSPLNVTKDVSGVSGIDIGSVRQFPFAVSTVNVPYPGSADAVAVLYFAAMEHYQQVVAR